MFNLLSAVEYAHSLGIIHRDIKLQNILVGKEIYDVYLADFGFSTTEKSSDLQLGTPGYMAPEIFLGEYTNKIDVFSTGIVMFILLTGQHPFADKNQNRHDILVRNIIGDIKMPID